MVGGQDLADGWAPLCVRSVEDRVFSGWWRRYGAFLITVVADAPFDPPRSLVDPPGLARAIPSHGWLRE